MNRNTDANSPQRLALDLQRVNQELKSEQERSQRLLSELSSLQAELERIKGSARRETDSRLQAEVALGESQERLQLAMDAAGLALWDCRYPFSDVYLSARWGELLGDVALEGSWRTNNLSTRLHPDDIERLSEELQRLLRGEKSRTSCEYRFKAKDEWIWLEAHAMVAETDSNGRVMRLMGTQSNITHRKQIEEKAAQARSLAEQASRAKSEFLANISHEIRTPLNAIMGLNQLLLGTQQDEEHRQWLHLMDDSSRVLLNLLNDVLDFSRIEAGKLQLEQVSFPLKPLFDSAYGTYLEQAKMKSVGLTFSLAPTLPAHMVGDPLRVRQVLTNLLSNAIKFTPTGGKVALSAEVVSRENQSTSLVFKIADTGVGIAPEQQQAMFEAFTQADSSTARRHGGSGLGLAICSTLVKMMGGHIKLESALGRGSTFEVEIPFGETSKAAEAPSASAAATAEEWALARKRFKGLRVILAEDNPTSERVMRDTLGQLGCTVRVAHNGEDAIRIWQGWEADLVLMDIQMPGVNGLTAASRIRAMERGLQRSPVPIVAVTANALSSDRDAFSKAGMTGHVAKPIELTALFDAMSAATRVRQQAAAGPKRMQPPPVALTSERVAQGKLEQSALESAQKLRAALAQRDAAAAKGVLDLLARHLAAMGAERALRICRGLDMARHAGEWDLFARALPLLENEIAMLLKQGDAS